jgi:hypothetical protein
MITKTFIALFSEAVTQKHVTLFVENWLARFESLEQVIPQGGASTLGIKATAEIMWQEQMQFRVHHGGDFSWIYLTENSRVVETSGLPAAEISLPLDVLIELPGIEEIIDGINERRLQELEKAGLL